MLERCGGDGPDWRCPVGRYEHDAADRQRLVKLKPGDRDQDLKHLSGQIVDAVDLQAVVGVAGLARQQIHDSAGGYSARR